MIPTERVYRMRSSQRILGIVFIAAGLFFGVGILFGFRDAKFLEMMFSILFLLFAVFITTRAFRNSVLVSDRRVELRTLRGTRTLTHDKIKGRRRCLSRGDDQSPGIWHLVIESDDDRFPKLDIEELYRFDDEFYAWFNALPDLDELDKTRPKPSNFGLV